MRNNMGNTPDDGNIVGTSAFYTPRTSPDPVIQPERDPYPRLGYADSPDQGSAPVPVNLDIPRPDKGGVVEAFQRLGFSWGLGAFRMATRMRGQTMEREPMGIHSTEGPVGFGTRSTLRPKYLYVDYTPNDEEVARAALSDWRKS